MSCIGSNGNALVSKEDLWMSLSSLWKMVRERSTSDRFAVPFWGVGIARFPSSRLLLIQLLLISFAIATRESVVTRKLSLIIYEKDYDPEEIIVIIQILNTLTF